MDSWEGPVMYAGYEKILRYVKKYLTEDAAPGGKAGYYDCISIQNPKPKREAY